MNKLRGATLIELVITIVVLSILLFAALPSFTVWLQNTQIRTAAEGILSGLQLARTESVRRNERVELRMDAGSGWTVSVVASGEVVQSRVADEGSSHAVVTIAPAGATRVTFGGLGRVVPNSDGSPSITEIKVDSNRIPATESREMCVTVSAAGVVRMCDPQVAAGDPRACVPAVPAGCL
jgi:type IV fimbrial biogenesis protein FimT